MEKNEEKNITDKDFSEIKIDNIKRFVDTQLDKLGLYEKIKHYVDDNIEDTDEEKIMQKLKEGGLIDEILESFKLVESSAKKSEAVDHAKKCLYLKLISGRGFVDYIRNNDETSYFYFDILFFGQRFQSKKIYISPQFQIDQSFLLDFNPLKLDIDLNFNLLKKISSPIHIVLLQTNGDEKVLVGTKSIEWRWALCYGSWKIEGEMYSPSTLNKLNVGTIELQLSFLPFIEKSNLLSERIIFEQLNDEKKNETESK